MKIVSDTDHPVLIAGDTVEYSLSCQVRTRQRTDVWVKMGVASSVQEGETADEALSRIVNYVQTNIDEQIDELAGN